MLSWDSTCQTPHRGEWLKLLGLTDAFKVFINCDVENAVIHLQKKKKRELLPLTFDHVSSPAEICFQALCVLFLNVIASWFVTGRSLSRALRSSQGDAQQSGAHFCETRRPHSAAVGNPSGEHPEQAPGRNGTITCAHYQHQNLPPHVFVFLKSLWIQSNFQWYGTTD